jgi:tetrahedral aminopeptidase
MNVDLLAKLSNAPGVSGFEHEAQTIVAEELRPYADELRTDRMGNVIALRRARKPSRETPFRLLYAAHIDEIGFMVSHIDDRGFIYFVPIGGFDARTLPSQRVTVHGTAGDRPAKLEGVIPTRPGWMTDDEDRKRVIPIDELFVDTGLPAERVKAVVQVGDAINLSKEFEVLNDEIVTGRNFDDRIGTYALVDSFRRIEHNTVDVYAVSTVQEEVGVRGVPTAAHAIGADICVAIDGSLPSDIPFAKPHRAQCPIGGGTGIYLMDNRTIGDRDLLRGLMQTCERHSIPFQRNIGGGTDASAVQRAGLGAKATTIGAPTRYMHSTVQLCHVRDIQATADLLACFPRYAHEILPDDWR